MVTGNKALLVAVLLLGGQAQMFGSAEIPTAFKNVSNAIQRFQQDTHTLNASFDSTLNAGVHQVAAAIHREAAEKHQAAANASRQAAPQSA